MISRFEGITTLLSGGVEAVFRSPRRRAWLAGPGLLAALLVQSPTAHSARAAPPEIRLEAEMTVGGPVAAVAISADESLLASVASGSGDSALVSFFDRAGRAEIGRIAAEVGEPRRLLFSPHGGLLAMAGSKALQLWEVPIQPLKPGADLPAKHLRWSLPLDDAPLDDMLFGAPAGTLFWTGGGALFRRAPAAGSSFTGEPVWRREEPGGAGIGVAKWGAGGGLALFDGENKALTLLAGGSMNIAGLLEGHRFPVVAAANSLSGGLTTLDGGANIIRWNPAREPEFIAHLTAVEGTPRPSRLLYLNHPYYLLITGEGGGGGGLLLDAEKRTAAAGLALEAGAAVAASPTGRYLLKGSGESLELFGFSAPMNPESYVRLLVEQNGHATARGYIERLDGKSLKGSTRAQLAAILSQTPPGVLLEDYLVGLTAAEREEDLAAMTAWAEKILALQPGHPRAAAVLARVRELADGRLLQQARGVLEQGHHRQAIALLSTRIDPESPSYGEALALIRRAEEARGIETALEQARDKMNLGDLPAAKALVNEVLRKEESNQAALTLRDEIAGRAGEFQPVKALLWGGALLALVLLGFGLVRSRLRWAPWLRNLSLEESEPLRKKSAPAKGPAAKAAPAARRRPATTAAPRPQKEERQLRLSAEENLEKNEALIRLCRQKDGEQRYTSLFLELEAELSATHRRILERRADLPAVLRRLGAINAQLIALQFPSSSKKLKEIGVKSLNHYEVLKLPKEAPQAAIKEAYHSLIKEYHPDLHSSSTFGWVKEEAEKMSRRISEAYEVLSDAAKRAIYDQELQNKRRVTK